MKQALLLFAITLFLNTQAQEDKTAYSAAIKLAEEQYHNKDYKSSAENYFKAFSHLEGKAYPNDRYNAACSYSLSNQLDSAFKHLFRLTEKSNYSNYNHIMVDSDLDNLKGDERWEEFVKQVKANKEEEEKDYDKELVKVLDKVYQTDQGIRMGIRDTITKYGQDSEEIKALWKEMHRIDSINQITVTQILDEHGWLGKDKIGSTGNTTLFLVIQHADIETQEKYLPMMRDAVEKGNARGSSLALLEDRVLLRNGKKQIYGSQIATMPGSGKQVVQPLKDPENVNERRASVGLGSIEEYVRYFGIEWNLEEYLKELPEIEKTFNIQD